MVIMQWLCLDQIWLIADKSHNLQLSNYSQAGSNIIKQSPWGVRKCECAWWSGGKYWVLIALDFSPVHQFDRQPYEKDFVFNFDTVFSRACLLKISINILICYRKIQETKHPTGTTWVLRVRVDLDACCFAVAWLGPQSYWQLRKDSMTYGL